MARRHTKKLLVEGKEDQAAIAYLLDAHLAGGWGNDRETWPIIIKVCDGVENVLAAGFIRTEIKSSESRYLGILIDADDVLLDRWRAIRRECIAVFPNLPDQLPKNGLVNTNPAGNRLGVWIFPDNQSRGMLETFLAEIIRDPQRELWNHAIDSAAEAKRRGAPFRDVHQDKAHMHTWLSWQDPPGRTIGSAIRDRCLDPHSAVCTDLIAWLKNLFELL